MLIDCQIQPSRYRLITYIIFNLIIVGLIGCSGLSLSLKIAIAICFSLLNSIWSFLHYRNLQFKTIGFLAIHQLWQLDRVSWCWRCVNDDEIYQGRLLSIDFRGVAVYFCFQTDYGIQHFTIWKDQVNQAEWRKIRVLSRLQQNEQNYSF